VDESFDRGDADVFAGDDEKAPPNALASEPIQPDRGPLSKIGVAAADGFLQQRGSDPGIDGQWGMDERAGSARPE
jgi:hypothetical protein